MVFSGGGTLDLTGLNFIQTESLSARIDPSAGFFLTGPTTSTAVDTYMGFSGPSLIGTGPLVLANSGSGDLIGVGVLGTDVPGNVLSVPQGFVSGGMLTTGATFENATFGSLGLSFGTYTYVLPHDTFTLQVGQEGAQMPENGSTLFLACVGTFVVLAGQRLLRRNIRAR